jgi:hypothetical protein
LTPPEAIGITSQTDDTPLVSVNSLGEAGSVLFTWYFQVTFSVSPTHPLASARILIVITITVIIIIIIIIILAALPVVKKGKIGTQKNLTLLVWPIGTLMHDFYHPYA